MSVFKTLLGNKMLKANFYSMLFYSTSFPLLNKLIVSGIDYRLISVNGLVICLYVIMFSALWQKYEKVLFKSYRKLLWLETIAYLVAFVFLYYKLITISVYYLMETVFLSAITKNIVMGGSVLKQLYFSNTEDRKIYDIQLQMTISVASIIGYCISALFNMSVGFSLICCFIGIVIDNIMFAQIYRSITPRVEEPITHA